jgi:hypothetical protein
VGLLAAVDRFVLREVQTETVLRPPVEAFTPAGRTRPLELPFHTAHTYQIMPCTCTHTRTPTIITTCVNAAA